MPLFQSAASKKAESEQELERVKLAELARSVAAEEAKTKARHEEVDLLLQDRDNVARLLAGAMGATESAKNG